MSRLVAVTQRVMVTAEHQERRDCLDQRWSAFLHACDLTPLVVPNDPAAALALVDAARPVGLVLTGGNDLAAYGGDAPERDATEQALVTWCAGRGFAVVGICRGFQMLAHLAGAELRRVHGHIAKDHFVTVTTGERRRVNSYHGWAINGLADDWEVLAVADDGVIEAARCATARQLGLMWHPERGAPFAVSDTTLFRALFGDVP